MQRIPPHARGWRWDAWHPSAPRCDVLVPPEVGARARVAELERRADAWARDPRVRRVADAVAAASPTVRAEALLRIAQRMTWRPNPPGALDCFETLDQVLGHGGTCKALACWLVAAARAAGLAARVVWIPQPGEDVNHVTAQLAPAGAWLWAEPSIPGARLGEGPFEAAARLGDRRALTNRQGGA